MKKVLVFLLLAVDFAVPMWANPFSPHTPMACSDSTDTLLRQVNVAVSPNDINLGDITGGGLYWPGDTVTLRAIPKQGCQFVNWGDSCTDNPLVFIVYSDTILIAYFESLNGISCIDPDTPVFSLNGRSLTFSNPQGVPVGLYDVHGHQLFLHCSSYFTFTLPASGIYIIKSKGNARKIAVH